MEKKELQSWTMYNETQKALKSFYSHKEVLFLSNLAGPYKCGNTGNGSTS